DACGQAAARAAEMLAADGSNAAALEDLQRQLAGAADCALATAAARWLRCVLQYFPAAPTGRAA
ncbi:MAG: hypothetical protein JWQ76_5566, partial [Ramlibacter sp.]|nr:hypothetical protein [Ramlibacter sp.]